MDEPTIAIPSLKCLSDKITPFAPRICTPGGRKRQPDRPAIDLGRRRPAGCSQDVLILSVPRFARVFQAMKNIILLPALALSVTISQASASPRRAFEYRGHPDC